MPGQGRVRDVARHQCVGGDAVVGPSLGGTDGEQDVGGLRLPVGGPGVVGAVPVVEVVEDDGGEEVADRGDRDDPGAVRRRECRVEAEGEGEVAQVVDGELRLPTVRCADEFRRSHHSGVVDQDVQRAVPGRHERGDRRPVGQVEPSYRQLSRLGRQFSFQACHYAGTRVGVPHGQGDIGARRGECPGRLHPDSGTGSGHHGPAAVQVDAVDHLGGGGACPEQVGRLRHGHEVGLLM